MNNKPSVAAPTHTFEAGDRIGRYRIEAVIGEGGMGLVLLARQIELDMPVAIKVIRPELAADERVVERLLEEARAVASLRSDHVVRVYDVGRLYDGTPYLVFELVEGPDLDRVLAEFGPMSVRDAVAAILDVCQGLAEAHRRGIVHRDIKPENLLVEPLSDGTSRIKISDFGIAKRSFSRHKISRTQQTESIGSPWYMSPEQILNARDIDPRADVWSTGVVLYEMLTGAVPFPGDSPGEVCAQVLSHAHISILSVRPDLPLAVESIISRCLAKERSHRYPDVGELALDLARLAPEWKPKALGVAARLAAEDVTLGRTLASIPAVRLPVSAPAIMETVREEESRVRKAPGITRRWPYALVAAFLVAVIAFFFVVRFEMRADVPATSSHAVATTPRRIPASPPPIQAPERDGLARDMPAVPLDVSTTRATGSAETSVSQRARMMRPEGTPPDYFLPAESTVAASTVSPTAAEPTGAEPREAEPTRAEQPEPAAVEAPATYAPLAAATETREPTSTPPGVE